MLAVAGVHRYHGAADEHDHRHQLLQRPQLVPGVPRQDLCRARRQRAAGAGRERGHQGHRRGILAVPAALLGGAGAADRRGGDRLGRRGAAGDEHPALGLVQLVRRRDVLPGRLPGRLANEFLRQTTDDKLAARNVSPEAQAQSPGVPGRGPLPPRAQLLARDRSVRQHPAGDRGGPDRRHPAEAEHPPGDLRFPGQRADRHPGRPAGGRQGRDLRPCRPRRPRPCCWRTST